MRMLLVATLFALLLPLVLAGVELSPADALLLKGLGAEAALLRLPIRALDRGIAHDEPDPRMTAFLRKLLDQQPVVKLAALGGSIAGYDEGMDPLTSFPDEVGNVLQRVFPHSEFEVDNLSWGATSAGFGTMCKTIQVPADVDIIVVEYTVNAYPGKCTCAYSPYVAGFETLVRRLMQDHPDVPIVLFSAFQWVDFNEPEDMLPPLKLAPYYESGEDLHTTVASYYGLPMVSVRDALYLAVMNGSLPMPLTDIVVDGMRLSRKGCRVYAALIIHFLQRKLGEVLHGTAPKQTQAEMRGTKLPPPMLLEAPLTGTCVPSWELGEIKYKERYGFHEYKPPLSGLAANKVGAQLVWEFNSSVAGAKPGQPTTLALLYFQSHRDGMGSIFFECLSGCSCPYSWFNAHTEEKVTDLTSGKVLVTPHDRCTVQLTNADSTASGGYRFRFEGYVTYVPPSEASSDDDKDVVTYTTGEPGGWIHY